MPGLFIFLIIGFGGFGIFRVIFLPHDKVGLTSILASFVCLGVFLRIARKHSIRSSHAVPTKRAISLKRVTAKTFTFFPGMAAGFAGYTDYNMMRARLNDDLMLRPPEDQFALLAFGVGFLSTLKARITAEKMMVVQCDGASESEAQLLGWLAYRPITMDYWRKAPGGLDESLDASGIASDLIDELKSTFLIAYSQGERVATNAHIAERH